jgi:hypothetical protein
MGLSPSFRRPNTIPADKADASVCSAIQSHDNSITDLNQAVASLKGQISGLTPASASTSGSATNTTSSTENITQITIGGGPVNNQSGVTAYITAQSDNGAEIVLNDASAIAVTLNQSATLPWYCFINNEGTGTATLTPQLGTINGAANLALVGGDFAIVFFDGMNFTALTPASAGSGVTSIVPGTNVTVSGPTGNVTVNATGTAHTVNLTSSTLAPGQSIGGTTAFTAPAGAVLMCSLYDATSPAANEYLSAFAYNQNGTIYWSVFNVSAASVTTLATTVLNIRVLV